MFSGSLGVVKAQLRWLMPVALLAGGCVRPAMVTKVVDGRVITTRSISPRAYEHAARALLYEEEERWQEAVAEYRLALDYDAQSPELHARLAEALLQLDRPKEAQVAIDRSLAIEPTVDGVVAAAHLHLHRGDPKAAARVLGDALLRFDLAEDAEAALRMTLERADAQVMALDLNAAHSTLDTLLQTRPTAQAALYRQAAVAWALADLAEARRYFERLVEIEPDHLEARLLLARLLTVMNNMDEARSAYVESLARSEGDLTVASLYATFLRQQELEDDAHTLADDLQVNETDPTTLMSRMELERAAGRLPRALDLADAVLATSPDKDVQGRVLLAKGSALEASHRSDEAVHTFMTIPQDAPAYVEGRLRAAALLRESGKVPEAQTILEALATDALDEAMELELTVARALLQASRQDLEGARQRLEDKFKDAASRDRITLAAASLEDKYGDWQRALRLAEQVLARDPSHVEALNFWAFVAAEQQHNLPLALKRAQAALALDPGSAAIMDTVGWIHHQSKRWDQAATFLEGAARIVPDEPEILAHVASLYAQRGQTELALARTQQALDMKPVGKLRAQLEALLQSLTPSQARSNSPSGGATIP